METGNPVIFFRTAFLNTLNLFYFLRATESVSYSHKIRENTYNPVDFNFVVSGDSLGR
jgi:hypothetical protein